jgi:lipid-A-disaccharide synthase
MLKIGILAGEPSGDLVASALIRAIKKRYPESVFLGIAGPKMIAEGCQAIFRIEQLSVMGVAEVFKQLPRLLSIRRGIKQYFNKHLPDILIGIDCPDFNLNIEAYFKKRNIPTVHYNSPTIWAWRKNRIKLIRNAVSLMLTLFPFETAIYEQSNIPVKFIGHPLADMIPSIIDTKKIRTELALDSNAKIIALLPGSRESELKYLGPLFLAAAAWCLQHDSNLRFIAPMINEARYTQFRSQCLGLAENFPLQLFVENTQNVIAASDAVLVASGTATLETALLQKPMVAAYRLNYLNYLIAKLLIKIPYFSLPNLLLNKPSVPEFFQRNATPENLGKALLTQLNLPKNSQIFDDFRHIRKILTQSSSEKAANAIIDLALCVKRKRSNTTP